MEKNHKTCDEDLEHLNRQLCDDAVLREYVKECDGKAISLLPRCLAGMLVITGGIMYGKEPSLRKFRAVEVIARAPYQSWQSVVFALQTFLYTDEKRALDLSRTSTFGRIGQDNETMHVVVISKLAQEEGKDRWIVDYFVPSLFALFYYCASWLLFLIKPRLSMELNYLFEQHAFEQYSDFLEKNSVQLKEKFIKSEFLDWYGRPCKNQFEFIQSVRNDEIIHRNRSIDH